MAGPGAEICPNCGQPFDAADGLLLWDDRRYCRPCVEAASPELARLAAAGAPLEDRLEFQPRVVLRAVRNTAWAYLLLALVGDCALAVAKVVFRNVHYSAWEHAGIVAVFTVVAFALALPSVLWAVWKQLPQTLSVHGGELHLKRRFDTRRFPLIGTEWKVALSRGWAGRIPPANQLGVPKRTALVLHVPLQNAWSWTGLKGTIVSCVNNDQRAVWVAFLRLAGIPEIL